MATDASARTYRMDMRMTAEQRKQIERAASLKGQNMTQWSLVHLIDDAQRDIMDATALQLTSEAFDEFVRGLDAPIPDAMQRLLDEEVTWAE